MAGIRNKNLRLMESWVWEQGIEDLIKQFITGRSINICCGTSKLGDVRVDLEPIEGGIIKADMLSVPYPDNSFDTVISDPPWKIGYYHRMKPFFECVRLCKVGGTIIYNATWIPESKIVELVKVYVRQSARFGNISVISIFRKTKDLSELSHEPPASKPGHVTTDGERLDKC